MSVLKVDTIKHSDGTATTEPSIPALDTRMASAWVHLNGVGGTPSIGDDYNVSSITENGVGNYRVNFNTSMSNTNFAPIVTRNDAADSTSRTTGFNNTLNVAYVDVYVKSSGALTDSDCSVVIFGGK